MTFWLLSPKASSRTKVPCGVGFFCVAEYHARRGIANGVPRNRAVGLQGSRHRSYIPQPRQLRRRKLQLQINLKAAEAYRSQSVAEAVEKACNRALRAVHREHLGHFGKSVNRIF